MRQASTITLDTRVKIHFGHIYSLNYDLRRISNIFPFEKKAVSKLGAGTCS